MDYRTGHQPGPLPRRRGNLSKKRLTARARWEREVGWEFINSIEEAGREVDPEDLPPPLEWEGSVWWLYQRIRTQWRIGGKGGAVGLDYNPAIALMQSLNWPLDLGLLLLQAVEIEMLSNDNKTPL